MRPEPNVLALQRKLNAALDPNGIFGRALLAPEL